MTNKSKSLGAVIAIGASAGAAAAILLGLTNLWVTAGIAIIGIVIGTGIARGKFAAVSARTSGNGNRRV
jgi:hypothetical protein